MKQKSADRTIAGKLQAAHDAGYIKLDNDQLDLVQKSYDTEQAYREYRTFHMTEVVPGLTDWTERQREHNVAEALAGIRSSEWTLLPPPGYRLEFRPDLNAPRSKERSQVWTKNWTRRTFLPS